MKEKELLNCNNMIASFRKLIIWQVDWKSPRFNPMIQDLPNELSRKRLADQQVNQELIVAQNVKTCIEAEFPNAQWLVSDFTDQQGLNTRVLNRTINKCNGSHGNLRGEQTLQLGRRTAF